MKCPKCNGIKQKVKISYSQSISVSCCFCWNKKDLDWIEYITGVDFDEWVCKAGCKREKEDEMSEMQRKKT